MFCLYGKGPVDRNRIIKTGGYQAVPEILKTESTGIFAINDEIAFGLYRGLAEAGKKFLRIIVLLVMTMLICASMFRRR